MDQDRVALTRDLAAALWRSASRSYGRTLDHWLAAEQMVAQSLTLARNAAAGGEDGGVRRPARSLATSAFPADHVRSLANCFWARSRMATGEASLDFWLAAERHVRALCAAAIAGAAEAAEPFSAPAHWGRVRTRAERLWVSDGCRDGRDLDNWLQAERELLADIAAGAGRSRSEGDAMDGDGTRAICYAQVQHGGHEARPN